MLEISDITISNLESGKLKGELPEFYELKKVTENNNWHNNESTFNHTIQLLKNVRLLTNKRHGGYLSLSRQKNQ